jgi:hypothetical protein
LAVLTGENPKAFVDRGGLCTMEAEAAAVAIRRVRDEAYPLIFKLSAATCRAARSASVFWHDSVKTWGALNKH